MEKEKKQLPGEKRRNVSGNEEARNCQEERKREERVTNEGGENILKKKAKPKNPPHSRGKTKKPEGSRGSMKEEVKRKNPCKGGGKSTKSMRRGVGTPFIRKSHAQKRKAVGEKGKR